jgi:hypothetical protein
MQNNKNTATCPACGVKIVGGDKVIFSVGAPGTRSRLWARVCQYAKKPGCINTDSQKIGEVKPSDYYGDIDDPIKPTVKPESVVAVVAGIMESTTD